MTTNSRAVEGRTPLTVALAVAGLLTVICWGVGAAGPRRQDEAQAVDLQALRIRGQAQFEETLYAQAVPFFREVVESGAATAQDYVNLAVALYRTREDVAALEALEGAGARDPSHPGVPYLSGLISKRAGDFEAARSFLEGARELDPTDPAIRYNLGAVYVQLQEQEAALQEFEVVTAMGFDVALQHYVSSLYQHFQILLRSGRREEAAPEVEAYRSTVQRLSLQARTQNALESSWNTEIRVPNVTLAPARAETSAEVRMLERLELESVPPEGRGLVVFDFNADDRPDVLVTASSGGLWLSSAEGYRYRPFESPAGPAAAGDFDRDGWPDLYVAHPDGDRLYRNRLGEDAAGAPLVPVEAVGLPEGGAPTSVLWVDFDHDGDLDVLVTHGSMEGAPVSDRLLRNQGGGEFLDVTEFAGLAESAESRGALWADFDSDFDVDLYLWRPGANALYSNQRSGRFEEIAAAVGAAGDGDTRAALAEDLDNDGDLDLLLASTEGFALLRNTGRGTFLPAEVEAFHGVSAAATPDVEVADWNNDSYLDLVVSSADGLIFLANLGDLQFEPFSPVEPGVAPTATAGQGAATPVEAADLDRDGAVDLLVEHGASLTWLRQEAPVGAWLSLRLTGVKNNLEGVGSMVEVKSGGLYQARPLRSLPLHFGLADAERVDVLRVRWPNGIVQNLLNEQTEQRIATTELERLEGSCPFLYTWDGRQWRFVNEVLGIAPLGMPIAEGVIHMPDADEYVPVSGDLLAPRDGLFEIRLTEELRETGYIDALRLLAVDHPEDLLVLPDERFSAPPHPRFRLFVLDQRWAVRAFDQDGRDWTGELAAVDGEWAVPFRPGPYDGLATPHALTLDLSSALAQGRAGRGASERIRLFLTGWVYWATGSVNLAADQDPRYEFTPVALEVPDGQGGWRVAIEDIGLPNAKNSTLAIDLTPHLRHDDARVRLSTTMRLYWDAARLTVGGAYPDGLVPVGDWRQRHDVPRPGPMALSPAGAPIRITVLEPTSADLRERGFSRLLRSADGYETFDYRTVQLDAPWEQHRGMYTRFGEVGELLQAAEDRYVIFGTGDELAVRFPDRLPELPAGWRRDFLVYLNGWVKDGDLNTLYGDRVEPLPFHGMSSYPYGPLEEFPDDASDRAFLEAYVTRPARAINAPLRPLR